MKVKVTRRFRDKDTKRIYSAGEVLEITDERFEEILTVGDFVVAVDDESTAEATESTAEDTAEDDESTAEATESTKKRTKKSAN